MRKIKLSWQWTDRGLFSEIYCLCLAEAYSNLKNINFTLMRQINAKESRHIQIEELFQIDYKFDFSSGCENIFECGNLEIILKTIKHSFKNKCLTIPPAISYNLMMGNNLAQSNLYFDEVRRVYEKIFVFNSIAELEINKHVKKIKINFGFEKYHAIHIRRGDKLNNESCSVRVEHYLNRLDFSVVKSLYVATDDFEAINEVRDWISLNQCESNIKLHYLCESKCVGYFQDKHNNLSKHEKLSEIYLLLAEYLIMKESETFVGTFSSNIGRSLYILRNGENTHGVDGDFLLNFDPYAKSRKIKFLTAIVNLII